MPRTVKYDVHSFGILLWETLSKKTVSENDTDTACVFAATKLLNTRCEQL